MFVLAITLSAAAEPTFSGQFTLADADAAVAEQGRAVESGVRQLPWAFRSLGRSRLAPRVWNCGRMRLELGDETLGLTCDDHPTTRFPLAGGPATWTGKDGTVYDLVIRRDAQRLVLHFTGPNGSQETTYQLGSDGSIRQTKRLSSKYLDTPVTWTADYRRE